MPAEYYIVGRSGVTFMDQTMHYDRDCPDDPAVRPVNADVVDEDAADFCPECSPLGDGSGSGTSDAESGPQSEPGPSATDGPDTVGGGEDGDESGASEGESDEPTCAGTTSSGEPCSREVDDPGDYCFQHAG